MNKLLSVIAIIMTLAVASCHHVEEWPDDPVGNFDALWTGIDRHYCFLDEKGIDWDSVYSVYRPQVSDQTDPVALFNICSDMLDELRDGHVNITSPFATSYYKKWWSDYPQNYNERLVDEYYLHFGGFTRGGFTYAILPDSIAYVRYSTFASTPGDATLDWMLMLLRDCHGMVFDIRDNGGGSISYVETIVSRFIDRRILAGYITHKSGPGHNEFSEPYAYYFDPVADGRFRWDKPVVVLTNRSTFSAANNFASVMSSLPQVTLIGDRTGGGSGMPFSSEMPCGWSYRFSASPVYDAEMRLTEFGVDPDIRVDLDPEMALKGIDTILETALEFLRNKETDSDSR
ncbi:MAG: S41 family peptidase [Bacteroidales bacterium]|nr:S41 family peptidase [Bacteroidales bacterium]